MRRRPAPTSSSTTGPRRWPSIPPTPSGWRGTPTTSIRAAICRPIRCPTTTRRPASPLRTRRPLSTRSRRQQAAQEHPTTVDYLVGTASGALSAEIVVGTTPGGELGGTWASPTVDATHSGSTHAATQAAAEATAASALSSHVADTTSAHSATGVDIADAGAYYTSTTVEGALQEIGAGGIGGGGGGGASAGELLISSSPSTPLVFADILQNSAQTDFVYQS
jgi:hypothetical protein